MEKFIYVFNETDKKFLLDRGYTLIKDETEKNRYVFENKAEQFFQSNDIQLIYSNTLTF